LGLRSIVIGNGWQWPIRTRHLRRTYFTNASKSVRYIAKDAALNIQGMLLASATTGAPGRIV
jgi:hypothetical protein